MKRIITNYSFSASGKTVTFNAFGTIELNRVLLITNTTTNTIIYNFADSTKGGTVATNVLTLTYNTASMNNTDKLQIYYDAPDDAVIIDETSSTTYTYFGFAVPATATSAAKWKVKRLTNSTSTFTWADGDDQYDNIWDNRASLSYS